MAHFDPKEIVPNFFSFQIVINYRLRQTSGGDSAKTVETPVKKSAWKQLNWSLEREQLPAAATAAVAAATGPPTPPANPWSRQLLAAPAAEPPAVKLSPSQLNRSFLEIMAEEVKVRDFFPT